jgi:hypothetical protein
MRLTFDAAGGRFLPLDMLHTGRPAARDAAEPRSRSGPLRHKASMGRTPPSHLTVHDE